MEKIKHMRNGRSENSRVGMEDSLIGSDETAR
jgi:hypothetical protein